MTSNGNRPVWLVDVDGVLNVNRPGGWNQELATGYARPGSSMFTMRWVPAAIDELRAIIGSGIVEVTWCTTWCDYAGQLEQLWQLPSLPRAFRAVHDVWDAKMAAVAHVIGQGRRLVWTDDDIWEHGK